MGGKAGDGEAVLVFDGPLRVRDGEARGFQLCGADGVYHGARAQVEGETVRLTSAAVPQPCGARYAMTNWTEGNICQQNGIPLPPLETHFQEKEGA